MNKSVAVVNVLIVAIAAVGYFSADLGHWLGLLLLGCMTLAAVKNPKWTIFLIIGVKLTLDLLWWIEPPKSLPPLRLTELAFIPLAVCLLGGMIRQRTLSNRVAFAGLGFVAWCVAVQLLNSKASFEIEVIVRLSGSLVGFLIGASFIESRRDLDEIARLALISTLIPVGAALLQVVCTFFDTPIFYYTTGSTRGIRYAGLHHDSGALGLVVLVAMLSSVYMLYVETARLTLNRFLQGYVGISLFLIAACGTRSVFFTAAFIVAAFIVTRFERGIRLLPPIAAALWLGYPYIETMNQKTLREVKHGRLSRSVELGSLLTETRYGTLLTGRIHLWQRVYREHQHGSVFQQLLGSGRTFNSHSSYFFLLLFVGKLGLLYYLGYNLLMLHAIYQSHADNDLRFVAMLGLAVFMIMGISLNTVFYTSFQWMLYLVAGGAIRVGTRPYDMGMVSRPRVTDDKVAIEA